MNYRNNVYPGSIIYGMVIVIFVCHQLLILNNIHIRLMDYYLDDLLVFPILLPVIGWVRMKLGWSDTTSLPGYLITISVVIYCLWFEVISPYAFHQGNSDPWDVVAYSLGAIGVWAWGNYVR